MKPIKVTLWALCLTLPTLQSVLADTIAFATDDTAGFTVSGDTYTRQLVGLDVDGVMFDALLTVTAFENDGSSGDYSVASTGLGITTGGGSALVHNGEYLGFELSTSNVSGGVITFDGFTEIIFTSFGSGDSGVLSEDDDASTLGDNFFTTTDGAGTVDISADSPTSFFAISGNPGQNTFRVDGVSVEFTGSIAAVPEPSSMVLLATASLGVISWRRRRG